MISVDFTFRRKKKTKKKQFANLTLSYYPQLGPKHFQGTLPTGIIAANSVESKPQVYSARLAIFTNISGFGFFNISSLFITAVTVAERLVSKKDRSLMAEQI